eukprot:COSAG02_NODE_186_length_30414_cov_24.815372_15_plen_74_part_00
MVNSIIAMREPTWVPSISGLMFDTTTVVVLVYGTRSTAVVHACMQCMVQALRQARCTASTVIRVHWDTDTVPV